MYIFHSVMFLFAMDVQLSEKCLTKVENWKNNNDNNTHFITKDDLITILQKLIIKNSIRSSSVMPRTDKAISLANIKHGKSS